MRMTIKEFKIQYALGSLLKAMKVELAFNPRTPKRILTILSEEENWHIKRGVAGNPNTPEDALAKLSVDRYWTVRNDVASNRSTRVDVLKQLCHDVDGIVIHSAKSNLYYSKWPQRHEQRPDDC